MIEPDHVPQLESWLNVFLIFSKDSSFFASMTLCFRVISILVLNEFKVIVPPARLFSKHCSISFNIDCLSRSFDWASSGKFKLMSLLLNANADIENAITPTAAYIMMNDLAIHVTKYTLF